MNKGRGPRYYGDGMARTVLITDGDTALGGELVRLLCTPECRVVTSVPAESPGKDYPSIPKSAVLVPWNRRSSASARNLVVSALNSCGRIDDAIVLDVPRASPLPVQDLPASEIERAFDLGLKPALFLVRELLSYFLQEKRGVLALASFSTRPQESFTPALERSVREAFKAFAVSTIAGAAESGICANAYQSYGATPEEFALFIDRTLQEKGRKLSGKWFTCQPRSGIFVGRRV